MTMTKVNRRTFLQVTALAGGGFMLALYPKAISALAQGPPRMALLVPSDFIRIAPDGEDSRVDIRSSSRYFESDLGSNAARISKFIEDLNTAAENASERPVKKPELPPTKAPSKTVKDNKNRLRVVDWCPCGNLTLLIFI